MSGSNDERPPDWSSTDELIDSVFQQAIACDQVDRFSMSVTALPNSHPFPQEIGPYSVVELLGEGGFGKVFLAYDPKLKRQVAIKVAGVSNDDLLDDAQKAAGLKHDRIVTLYGIETDPVIPFYVVMEYMEGGTLAERITDRGRMSAEKAATFLVDIADAVQHAHEHGIIHRDLKPANILLDREGRPHIADFGLAVSESHASDPSGRICGTARYMSPEQIRGESEQLDARTDVWSLGVILYELLTGQTPFSGSSREEVFESILRGSIQACSVIHPIVPRDLEAICLKCLEKQPERRYPTAAELRDDLRRYMDGTPSHARAVGRVERLLRWAKRRRVAMGLMIAVSLLLTVVVAGIKQQRKQLAQAARTATQLEHEAAEHERQVRKYDYARTLQAAQQAWKSADLTAALELLSRVIPQPGEEDLRSFEWYYLRRQIDGALRTHAPNGGRIYGIAYSPDGNRLAACAEDGKVRIWDSTSSVLLGEFQADSQAVYAIAFSTDGKQLATAGEDRKIRLWNATDFQAIAVLEGHDGGVTCLAYSPDGKRLATGSEDTTVRVWDVATGRLVGTVPGHEKMVHCLTFSLDGTQLFSGSEDGVVQVTNPESPDDPTILWHGDGRVFALAPSPDGRVLAVARETIIFFLDLQENTQNDLPLEHRNTVRSLAFSPDGQTFASAGDDQTIRIWDTQAELVKHIFGGHTDRVYQLDFCPVDGLLASASKDGSVKIWNPSVPQQRDSLLVLAGQTIFDVAFSPDGSRVATISYDGARTHAWLWNTASREEIASRYWINGDNHFFRLAFLQRDAGLVFSARKESIILWDTKQDTLRTLDNGLAEQSDIALEPNNKLLAIAGTDHASVVLVDMETGSPMASLPGQRCVEFSPNGRLIAFESAKVQFAVELWDVRANRSVAVMTGHKGYVYDVKFSHDGRYLATACDDSTARLWDVASAIEIQALRVEAVKCVAFHPSGKRLATASVDGVILWDVETGAQLFRLPIQSGENVLAVDFSPDGAILATASWNGKEGRVDLWLGEELFLETLKVKQRP